MDNLSNKINYFKQLLDCSISACFWELDPELNIIETNCSTTDYFITSLNTEDCFKALSAYAKSNNDKPLILCDSLSISWIITAEIKNNIPCRLYMIGPVLGEDVSKNSLLNHPKFRDAEPQQINHIFETISCLPLVPFSNWIQYGIMLHYTITGEKVSISDFICQESQNKNNISEQTEKPISPGESTWLFEQAVMEYIEKGCLDYKNAFAKLSDSSFAANLAVGNDIALLRQNKNYVISFITLATRAAIRGGLDVEVAYTVGNNYLSSVEQAQSTSELLNINKTMYADFVGRVHRFKEENSDSRLVRSCMNYIDFHIEEKITASSLAKHLCYSSSYIAHRFKDETGITISEYIQNRKIEEAKKLVASSTISIGEISNKLNFCNCSYFIDLFKKKTGFTPQEYRNR